MNTNNSEPILPIEEMFSKNSTKPKQIDTKELAYRIALVVCLIIAIAAWAHNAGYQEATEQIVNLCTGVK